MPAERATATDTEAGSRGAPPAVRRQSSANRGALSLTVSSIAPLKRWKFPRKLSTRSYTKHALYSVLMLKSLDMSQRRVGVLSKPFS